MAKKLLTVGVLFDIVSRTAAAANGGSSTGGVYINFGVGFVVAAQVFYSLLVRFLVANGAGEHALYVKHRSGRVSKSSVGCRRHKLRHRKGLPLDCKGSLRLAARRLSG
jgi:hypothetical protein